MMKKLRDEDQVKASGLYIYSNLKGNWFLISSEIPEEAYRFRYRIPRNINPHDYLFLEDWKILAEENMLKEIVEEGPTFIVMWSGSKEFAITSNLSTVRGGRAYIIPEGTLWFTTYQGWEDFIEEYTKHTPLPQVERERNV